MRAKYSIRLSDEEKRMLTTKSEKLGYGSASGFARELIQRGLHGYEMKKTEEHMLYNSAQAVFLLRELITLFLADESKSTQVIHGIKHTAEEWVNKFKAAVGE